VSTRSLVDSDYRAVSRLWAGEAADPFAMIDDSLLSALILSTWQKQQEGHLCVPSTVGIRPAYRIGLN
jgi:hypothetical protein